MEIADVFFYEVWVCVLSFGFEFVGWLCTQNGLKWNKTTEYGTIQKENHLFTYLITKIDTWENML